MKMDFLNALSHMTIILSNLSVKMQYDIPKKTETISFMVVSSIQGKWR